MDKKYLDYWGSHYCYLPKGGMPLWCKQSIEQMLFLEKFLISMLRLSQLRNQLHHGVCSLQDCLFIMKLTRIVRSNHCVILSPIPLNSHSIQSRNPHASISFTTLHSNIQLIMLCEIRIPVIQVIWSAIFMKIAVIIILPFIC